MKKRKILKEVQETSVTSSKKSDASQLSASPNVPLDTMPSAELSPNPQTTDAISLDKAIEESKAQIAESQAEAPKKRGRPRKEPAPEAAPLETLNLGPSTCAGIVQFSFHAVAISRDRQCWEVTPEEAQDLGAQIDKTLSIWCPQMDSKTSITVSCVLSLGVVCFTKWMQENEEKRKEEKTLAQFQAPLKDKAIIEDQIQRF